MSHNWAERIENTIPINPGSGELLQAVVGEIDNGGYIIFIHHTLYGELKI